MERDGAFDSRMFGSLNAEGRTSAWYEDGHSHGEDATVGLATQLVRVVGTSNVQSRAERIADLLC